MNAFIVYLTSLAISVLLEEQVHGFGFVGVEHSRMNLK